ncbi:MAG: hypothetical protein N3A66_06965 [Planctomycetota bacterium]|nr:hypothetical protein [Planctomycetota bacterium]
MATNGAANDRTHIERWNTAIRAAAAQGETAFQSWFNQAESVAQATVRGYWDFAVHILTSAVCAAIREPEKLTALEIGYGGGRLLNASHSAAARSGATLFRLLAKTFLGNAHGAVLAGIL